MLSWRRGLYTTAFYALLPLILGRLWWRGRKNPSYRQRWPERFGFAAEDPVDSVRPVLCLHAVSVGEVMAAKPLIEALLARYTDHDVWVTTTTPTGSATVRRLFGSRVKHAYLPYDTPAAVRRFLGRLQPVLLLVMETELWPNLYLACARRQIPLLLVNARLSERSVRRYQAIRGLLAEVLPAVTRILARGQQDADYFQQLGAMSVQLSVVGNIKFAIMADRQLVAGCEDLRARLGGRLVWCAGSTHQGEDERILAVHARLRRQFPGLLLILVPRHPERFTTVAALCEQAALTTVRRSLSEPVEPDTAVLLGDSMGELLLWFAVSDVAFIGGSLVPVGGHNPLEALLFAVPVVSGQHVANFTELYAQLATVGCVRLIETDDELHDHLAHWLGNAAERERAGVKGKHLLESNQQVIARLMAEIAGVMRHKK